MNNNHKGFYVWGALLGLGVGIVSAHFYKQALENNTEKAKPSIRDMMAVTVALVGVMRQIAEVGSGKKAKQESRCQHRTP